MFRPAGVTIIDALFFYMLLNFNHLEGFFPLLTVTKSSNFPLFAEDVRLLLLHVKQENVNNFKNKILCKGKEIKSTTTSQRRCDYYIFAVKFMFNGCEFCKS